MTDWKALCAQLADELERFRPLAEVPDCLQRARAALAGPVLEVVEPTVMEIIELADEIEAAELGQVDFARAVLARWGNHFPDTKKMVRPAPAPAEMAELVRREVVG